MLAQEMASERGLFPVSPPPPPSLCFLRECAVMTSLLISPQLARGRLECAEGNEFPPLCIASACWHSRAEKVALTAASRAPLEHTRGPRGAGVGWFRSPREAGKAWEPESGCARQRPTSPTRVALGLAPGFLLAQIGIGAQPKKPSWHQTETNLGGV